MSNSIVQLKLRAECSSLHRSIENSTLFGKLIDGEIEDLELIAMLKKMYCIHSAFKTYLSSVLSSHPAIKFIHKACRLEELTLDLAHYGTSPEEFNTEINLPNSIDSALGVLYVLLGSTLGGAMISKSLTQRENSNTRPEVNFFSSNSLNRMDDWKEFLQILEQHSLNTEDEFSLLHAAKYTFSLIHQEFINLEVREYV